MTLTLELSPAEEAALAAQARARHQEITDRAHEILSASLGLAAPQLAGSPAASDPRHADLLRRLQAAGLLTKLPTQPLEPPPKPITVLGPPVSQTLLEDREH